MPTGRSGIRAKLDEEARRIEEDTIYFAKSLYKASDLYGRGHAWASGLSALLAGIAGFSALKEVPYGLLVAPYAPLLSLVAASVMTIVALVKPGDRAEVFKRAGALVQATYDQARIYREIHLDRVDLSDSELIARLEEVARHKNTHRQEAPLVPEWAYRAARKALAEGQHDYRVDRPA